MAPEKQDTCSFCGKPRDKAKKVIAGMSGAIICNDCVVLCYSVLLDLGVVRDSAGDKPSGRISPD